jgi:hypothetical protein
MKFDGHFREIFLISGAPIPFTLVLSNFLTVKVIRFQRSAGVCDNSLSFPKQFRDTRGYHRWAGGHHLRRVYPAL